MSNKTTIIRPGNQSFLDSIQEFWEYRDLLYMLTVRRVSVRYKQTIIGLAWVLLQPLIAMVIFSVIFGNFAKLPSDGIPYPIFSYSALILWGLFSQGLTRAGTSLVSEQNLITKVYFPRLIIPLAAVGSAWIDFAISLFLLFPLICFYDLRPTWSLLLLPIAMVLTMILAVGVGILFAALNVRYRDFQHAMQFLVQIWLYVSPVVYSVSIVPESISPIYYLNPMAGLIELCRFAITGQDAPSMMGLAFSVIGTGIFFVFGLIVFRFVERSFADFI